VNTFPFRPDTLRPRKNVERGTTGLWRSHIWGKATAPRRKNRNIHRGRGERPVAFVRRATQTGLLPARLSLSGSPRPLCTGFAALEENLVFVLMRPFALLSRLAQRFEGWWGELGPGAVLSQDCLGTGKNPASARRRRFCFLFFFPASKHTLLQMPYSRPHHSRSVCNRTPKRSRSAAASGQR
jgi:hypothetical protein